MTLPWVGQMDQLHYRDLFAISTVFFYLVCEAIVPASGDSKDDCGEADGL
jgi:hypothetical protein